MLVKDAWYRIDGLVFRQSLNPGIEGVDRYRIWKVASEWLPVIRREVSRWNPKGVCSTQKLKSRRTPLVLAVFANRYVGEYNGDKKN